jgi:hypothetical protein
VAELWEVKGAAKIRILGPAEALDALEAPDGVSVGRVAPDEVLWLGDPGRAAELEERAGAATASLGRQGLVVDHSDGWVLFSLVGDDGPEVLARLSTLRLPEGGSGFVQGQVAQAPAKLFVRPGRLDLLVGSELAWFVHERLVGVGSDLGLREAEAPAEAAVSGASEVGTR